MVVFYKEGEEKKRPGVYQRYTNIGQPPIPGAVDGICAIPIRAQWGPLGKVVKNTLVGDLIKNYGVGTYGTSYTVPAAAQMFYGGATTVYTYRLGTGGTKASITLTQTVESGTAPTLVVTAKYEGTMPLSIMIQNKVSDATKKEFMVYVGTSLAEKFDFTADATTEGANLIAAIAGSDYVTAAAGVGTMTTVPLTALAAGALTGGTDPTIANSDYSAAFNAMESFYYNTIALDVNDDANMTLSLLLQAYLDNAYTMGKFAIAIVGEPTTVSFETRMTHAYTFNDGKVVYLGGGYKAGTENRDGALAICYTAGLIASTPSNQGITHMVIPEATELMENLTYAQYEQAVDNGALMLSMAPDGSIWYDTGITTLNRPNYEIEDDGWKKIRRVKVRFELFERMDRILAPKVGRITNDTDGVADVIQAGQRLLDAMSNLENKLLPGATIYEDPQNPHQGDSAWFIIQADDLDSLEKIYLHYEFRYSQLA